MGKINERILDGSGNFKSFPAKERAKAQKKGLVEPLPEEIKEIDTSPRGALKKKLNKKAKANNAELALKQKLKDNDERMSGDPVYDKAKEEKAQLVKDQAEAIKIASISSSMEPAKKEISTAPKGGLKKKINKKARNNNAILAAKQKKRDEEQKLSGN